MSLLTTQEAAKKAGVGATAVKRWADAGLLPCVRTAGGHRRFEERAVLDFLNSIRRSDDDQLSDVEVWLDQLLAAESSHEVEAQLLLLRAKEDTWYRAAEFVGAVLAALGEAYANGAITVLEEHFASERLFRALVSIAESLPVAKTAPTAMMVMVEGDDHVLGLTLVELCFRESGLRTLWAGRFTPAVEIASFLAETSAKLVAASASIYSSDRAALAKWVKKVGAACESAGATLLIGGSGAWPEGQKHCVRIDSFASLHAFIKEELK